MPSTQIGPQPCLTMLLADATADVVLPAIQAQLLTACDETTIAPRHAPLGHPSTSIRPLQPRGLSASHFALACFAVNAPILPDQSIVILFSPGMACLRSILGARGWAMKAAKTTTIGSAASRLRKYLIVRPPGGKCRIELTLRPALRNNSVRVVARLTNVTEDCCPPKGLSECGFVGAGQSPGPSHWWLDSCRAAGSPTANELC